MSTTAQFLHDLSLSGVQVVLQNGRPHVIGPQVALTSDVRWLLQEHRNELQAGLSMSEQAGPEPGASPSPAPVTVTTAGTFLPALVALAHVHCAQPGRIAIDLETTGLDPRRHKVVSIALGVPGHVTILDMRPYYALPAQEQARWCEALRQLLDYGGTTWIGQNLKFDWQFLSAHFGAHLDTVFDTMLAEQVLYGARQERGRAGFTLQEIAARYDFVVSKAKRTWFVGLDTRPDEWAAPFPEEEERYMVQDIEIPYRIAEQQQSLLERNQLREVAALEFACLPALAALELHGTLIDRERWREALQRKQVRRDALAASLSGMLREPLAHARAQQAATYQNYQQARQAEEKRLMCAYTRDDTLRRAQSWQRTTPRDCKPGRASILSHRSHAPPVPRSTSLPQGN